jgi:hypothetical protein
MMKTISVDGAAQAGILVVNHENGCAVTVRKFIVLPNELVFRPVKDEPQHAAFKAAASDVAVDVVDGLSDVLLRVLAAPVVVGLRVKRERNGDVAPVLVDQGLRGDSRIRFLEILAVELHDVGDLLEEVGKVFLRLVADDVQPWRVGALALDHGDGVLHVFTSF